MNNNKIAYEYDRYDIIDFLEPDYIDYLNLIPDDIWEKYQKYIEDALLSVENKLIIDLVFKKIKIKYVQYVLQNFSKINFKLFRIIMYKSSTKILNKLKKFKSIRENVYRECILKNNLEFNEYLYGSIFVVLNQTLHHDIDELQKIFQSIINMTGLLPKYYDVFKYYYEKYIIIVGKNKQRLFFQMYKNYNINNFKNLIELINLIKIPNNTFVQEILFNKIINYDDREKLIFKISNTCDPDYFIQVMDYFTMENNCFHFDVIVNIIVEASLTKNIDLVIVIINYLKKKKKVVFTKEIYSRIIYFIIKKSGPKYNEYDNIIYEFINLGGVVKGYGVYTDYIESIKFLNITPGAILIKKN